ncbi:hypothetical protein H8356DRAFT_1356380 [Neocallimastix lanati (nom. inval.)]|nr:hypothetical protein H8356DRAFT_1356380 [Neocallimastix sp. JGI-2020a]
MSKIHDKKYSFFVFNKTFVENFNTISTFAAYSSFDLGTINFYVNISIYITSQEVTQESESDYEDNINHLLLNILLGGHAMVYLVSQLWVLILTS